MDKKMKPVSVKQAKDICANMAKITGADESVLFDEMVAKKLVSSGRGCYTPYQEFMNLTLNPAIQKAHKDALNQGLIAVNSKGQVVEVALNHKAVK